jgi:hypothetical protein
MPVDYSHDLAAIANAAFRKDLADLAEDLKKWPFAHFRDFCFAI